MFRCSALLAGFVFALAGCSATPEIGLELTSAERAQPYPTLMPLSSIDLNVATPRTSATQIGGLASLKSRADALRGPVIPPDDRDELEAAIERRQGQ
ncbi:hypothetical protein ACFE33_13165 [Falsihalocynthiibacter sp. SS001]|uniref:hypothetical protein n=1 Tax=Falsihalocynthiibacter sp. SS001 TaxID=3349698 RepID=UPI0036D24D0E